MVGGSSCLLFLGLDKVGGWESLKSKLVGMILPPPPSWSKPCLGREPSFFSPSPPADLAAPLVCFHFLSKGKSTTRIDLLNIPCLLSRLTRWKLTERHQRYSRAEASAFCFQTYTALPFPKIIFKTEFAHLHDTYSCVSFVGEGNNFSPPRYMTAVANVTYYGPDNSTCGLPREDAWQVLREARHSDMPWPGFLLGQTPASIW